MKKFILLVSLMSAIGLTGCSSSGEETASDSSSQSTSESDILETEEYFNALVDKLEPITTDNYNEEDYGFYDYKDILRASESIFGTKIKIINFNILQIINEGEYQKILGSTPNGDIYMAFIEDRRLETKLLEDDNLHFNGQFAFTYIYTTVSDVEKEVPLIYINAYILN